MNKMEKFKMKDIIDELGSGPLVDISSKEYIEWKNKEFVSVDNLKELLHNMKIIIPKNSTIKEAKGYNKALQSLEKELEKGQ